VNVVLDAASTSPNSDGVISLAQLERLSVWQSGYQCADQPSWAWVFQEVIDDSAVRTAWERTLSRYGYLRTVFIEDNGLLRRDQWPVAEALSKSFVVAEPEVFEEEVNKPLLFLGGVLTRIVHSVSGRESRIGLCFDHMIIDAGTAGMVIADLWRYLRGEDPTGPDPVTPDEFIRRELEAAQSHAVVERVLSHWRRNAEGLAYPPPYPGLERKPHMASRPEVAFAEVRLADLAGPRRIPLFDATAVLSAASAAIIRARAPGAGVSHFTTLVQGSRRKTAHDMRTIGFLANWLVMRLPASPDPATVRLRALRSLMGAMAVQDIHHAEVVRLLQPELYGARYQPREVVPPYAMFNYEDDVPQPRTARSAGLPLKIPQIINNNMHAGLFIDAMARTGGQVTVRIVADSAVFGEGFADAVTADLSRSVVGLSRSGGP
jgi:hypothetical protein